MKPVVAFTPSARRISLRCDRDCVYRARLVRLPGGSVTAWKNGRTWAGQRLFVLAGLVTLLALLRKRHVERIEAEAVGEPAFASAA